MKWVFYGCWKVKDKLTCDVAPMNYNHLDIPVMMEHISSCIKVVGLTYQIKNYVQPTNLSNLSQKQHMEKKCSFLQYFYIFVIYPILFNPDKSALSECL